MSKHDEKLLERLIGLTEITDTCWLWYGCKNQGGYGQISIKNIPRLAHRITYEIFKGDIPRGLEIDHLCRVRNCINPDHLESVTKTENNRRAQPFRASLYTHSCGDRHLKGDNLYISPNGDRNCRECNLKSVLKYQRKKVARNP